jgi:hypothetical protein
MSFRTWLLKQKDRDDPVGAYVRDTRHHFTMRLLRLLAGDWASARPAVPQALEQARAEWNNGIRAGKA